MRIALVNMPWAPIDVPSLALGILRNTVARSIPDAEVVDVHAHLDYLDWCAGLTVDDYRFYSDHTYFEGYGDWIFSAALYDDPDWRVAEFRDRYAASMTPGELSLTLRLHGSAPRFVADLADRLAAIAPDIVGFTSTFQQTTATLATARRLKLLKPDTIVILGGANCDGVQGAALHRNFPFIDYVVRGEGEAAFPQLLTFLATTAPPSPPPVASRPASVGEIPGLCRRASDGTSTANPMRARPLRPSEIVAPDYGTYFDRLDTSTARDRVEPKLVVEGSRGCWWGEKHHCTFCGLNGTALEFRSKSPDRFYGEIMDLVERHRIRDMFVVDNILDMGYLNSVLPRIAESGQDLRLRYEVKSNLRRDQLETLVRAGLTHVQPGVESLSGRVLGLMGKGVTGCQNVRLLRDAASVGLSLSWNYLYGFPGETDDDYESVLRQLPALHHLAPAEQVARIAIERFSPYFDRPELGFPNPRPRDHYRLTYDLPDRELADLAYLFDAPPQGIDEPLAARLSDAVTTWRDAYPTSTLTYEDADNTITLTNTRPHYPWTTLRLKDPREITAFRLLDQPRSACSLERALPADRPWLTNLLGHWHTLGLLYTDTGQYLHVATTPTTHDLTTHSLPPRWPGWHDTPAPRDHTTPRP
ncbi:RiPP maturation radical SAM protein 1 [Sphaerisporangium krabiense]|uniref:Ribosomal peptide maturation radical SAM protein 1 n=1 Tax=Sphaerisporangium krabiense TaxID=763782 RepID=A0A7W8Z6M7_9ACTN|nr:RiPP maturation radical SAM C-methyltransferase [Sphaerisporangium krabiense]MBB5628458.1 ribosomal peptide maturation radical SAM protein 1 [Sphaerisporangium krabiense]GII66803.1 RiPP maturation radical SAM protein 1 [Sphaerisporangium krabiense]